MRKSCLLLAVFMLFLSGCDNKPSETASPIKASERILDARQSCYDEFNKTNFKK